jgi:hypothetical protein
MKMKLFNKKPRKSLEDLRAEYTAYSLQNRRDTEAKQLTGKIWAMKHPMLSNIGTNMAQQSKGKGNTKNPWTALAGIDKRIIGK